MATPYFEVSLKKEKVLIHEAQNAKMLKQKYHVGQKLYRLNWE